MKFEMTYYKIFLFGLLFCSITLAQNKNILKPNLNNTFKKGSTEEKVLVKIADKIITVKEFYERSEYTIRPQYAKGNSELEKKIILNSLIAEKLLAIEKEKNCELLNQKKFRQTILGRKEQKMRHLLFYQEGFNKASIDSAKFTQQYNLAGREYDVEFVNITEEHEAQYIKKQLFQDSISFKQMYFELTSKNNVPRYTVKWNSPEYPKVSEILFNKTNPEINKIYGPIKLNDSFLFMKVNGWTDKPAITQNDQSQRYANVKEKLLMDDGVNHYAKFVKNVMKGKKLDFDKKTFYKLVKAFAPIYRQNLKEKKEEFADKHLKQNKDIRKQVLQLDDELSSIQDDALMTIDGQIWTVKMFTEEIEKHPLVFRNKNFSGKDFPKHFRIAIVDLIRDKYLTQVAYNYDLDKEFIVKRVENMWTDALISFYEQNKIQVKNNTKEFLTYKVVNEIFTPLIDKLQKKYSDKIEINIEEFVKLKLTRIDMFALEKNVPYPIIVPAFPNITTDYHLEYGKKLK